MNNLKPSPLLAIQNFIGLIHIHICDLYKYSVILGYILQYFTILDNIRLNYKILGNMGQLESIYKCLSKNKQDLTNLKHLDDRQTDSND